MSDSKPMRVSFIGCGNISGPYAESLKNHQDKLEIAGAFDIVPEASKAFVEKYGGRLYNDLVDLLSDDTVDLVVNLTTHLAHGEVTRSLLTAGKNVHSEKPLATSREEARACVELAEEKDLLLSCSPFVILGEAQQSLRQIIGDGMVGEVREVYAEMNHGRIETWHPAPGPFYAPGAGPLLDVGCYPLHVLTQIFGSVASVRALADINLKERTIGSGPKKGETFMVTTPDHCVVLMEFESGMRGRLTTSFFGVKSAQSGLEIHGTEGSLHMDSVVAFNAKIRACKAGEGDWTDLPLAREAYPGVEWARGVLDIAASIRQGTPLTCPGLAAYHILDICMSALESAELDKTVKVASTLDAL